MLASFNPPAEERRELTVAGTFKNVVKTYGSQTAVIATDKTLSYTELDQESNRIANALIKMGVGVGDKIGFMLKRDSRLQVTMLGIAKSGAAFIPIDPEYPINRIKNIVEDSLAKLLISDNDSDLTELDVVSADYDDLIKIGETAAVDVEIDPDDLSYIIFTSGSTGRPKGVMLKQKGLVNYITPSDHNTFAKGFVDHTNTLVSITTVSFDVFLKENMTSLLNGKTLVLANEDQVNDPAELAKLMTETAVDGYSSTPTRMIQYLESKAFEEAVASLSFIICGGEKFPPGLYTQLSKITKARIFNSYGPTEISISSNAKELTNELITIGKPLSNVREYICDPDGNLLPVGVVGELYIGGMGVGRGYLNNPEQTRKAFIDYQGERIYKTGDFARWTDDGEVVILGRMDGQIKLRGLRIELGEIENAMLAYEGLK
ncbi:MAG: hypothetical protein PWP20_488 [Eubacteriaceae bacterium]|nr:hypothetical protein [Eubacteriaceae bacterium]